MKIIETFRVAVPRVVKYKEPLPCVNPDLIIGLELETEQCDRWNADGYIGVADRCNFNTETDGSLRGRAYEFISRPMRSDHALGAMAEFFRQTGFTEANYSDRCSVHVHVNCTDMTLEQVSNVALIYSVFEEILFEYVGHHRETNIFCIPWNQCLAQYKLIENFLSAPGNQVAAWNKYTALNLIPLQTQGTVEFRQMHGTCDMEKLTTWINLIGAMFLYAKKAELKDLTETIKTLNTTSHYEAFFRDVLQNILPYNEVYQQRLEEGIILAKSSLITSGRSSKATVEAAPPRAPVAVDGATLMRNYIVQQGDAIHPGRDITWDAVPAGVGNIAHAEARARIRSQYEGLIARGATARTNPVRPEAYRTIRMPAQNDEEGII